MKRTPFVLLIALLATTLSGRTAAGVPAARAATLHQPAKVLVLMADFKATVYQGPDRGLTLKGELHLRLRPSGRLFGTLQRKPRRAVRVTGQLTGQAINLVLILGPKRIVYGVGAIAEDIRSKRGERLMIPMGGPFVGPKDPDFGSWLAYLCMVVRG